ncbi:MAG: hypothetical protein U0802_10650 [Candidatus Binatia bacterium]
MDGAATYDADRHPDGDRDGDAGQHAHGAVAVVVGVAVEVSVGVAVGVVLGDLFCADGVCCNRPCTGPNESCVLPHQVGICAGPQAVPAVSGGGLAAAVAAMTMLAWLSLYAWRRRGHQ